MAVGFSLSGKTKIIKKILKKYPKKFFVIDTRSIHDYLNKQYDLFQDNNTVDESIYKTRQRATDAMQLELLKVMVEDGFSIIKDSCNQVRADRKKQFEIVKSINPKIKTVILYVNPSEKELLETISKYDQKLLKKGQKPTWIDLYQKVQKERMQIPTRAEADFFIEFDRHNEKSVLSEIESIVF
jgi:hypothetical protein